MNKHHDQHHESTAAPIITKRSGRRAARDREVATWKPVVAEPTTESTVQARDATNRAVKMAARAATRLEVTAADLERAARDASPELAGSLRDQASAFAARARELREREKEGRGISAKLTRQIGALRA